ncbi:hypothetical protein KAJ71_16185, partial [Serratia sp. arafor3]|nr:hypothetical protein [Serratia silvae]
PCIEQDDARGYAKKCARCLRYMHIQEVLLSKSDLFNKAPGQPVTVNIEQGRLIIQAEGNV